MSHKHHHDARKDQPAEATVEPTPAAAAESTAAAGEPQTPQQQLEAVTAERDNLMSRLQRVSADYLNYQKRVQRDIVQAREFANEELIKSLLHVLDDMDRALEHARLNSPANDPLLVGMELVYTKALDTLGRFGLKTMQAQGQPFDPEQHSALMQQPSNEVPPQTVLKELQKGYTLKGRTIRPAHVIVSQESQESGQDKE